MEFLPGKYYLCTLCGRANHRTSRAKHSWLPCGHATYLAVEISESKYLQFKETQREVSKARQNQVDL